MLSTLASHNEDIRLLIEKGYAVSIDSNYLVIRDVFYLDDKQSLQKGAIISKLVFVNQNQVRLHDHQIFFCGTHPCEINGKPISNLGGGPTNLSLASPDLVVQRTFSNKPPAGFRNFFDKIESYVTIVSGPAMTLYNANPFTFGTQEDSSSTVFKVRDTLTSRAEIGDLADLFKNEVVAIIGLGGTGAYVLDFMTKTPVKEIRGFDGDWFHAHTAFRSPGKLSIDTELGSSKAAVYQARYESFRSGISIYPKYILADSTAEFEGVTFAFVCVDKGASRKQVFDVLIGLKIPFIDVGIGLDRQSGPVSGAVRITHIPIENPSEILNKNWVPMSDIPDDIYRHNIQISELNALNACHAVIRYKQLRGFYANDTSFNLSIFTIDGFQLAVE